MNCEKCGTDIGRRHDVDCPDGRVMMGLDAHGAPPGETVEERLRLWAERERGLRNAARAMIEACKAAERRGDAPRDVVCAAIDAISTGALSP